MAIATDVVVVGAGVAGLAVARWLAQAGIAVVVVEATDRLGGRILSSPYRTDAQLGAEFIHGSHHVMRTLLTELQLGIDDYLMDGGDGRFFLQAGRTHKQGSAFANDVEDQYERLHSYAGEVDCSVATFAEQAHVQQDGPGAFARARVTRIEAADLADLSALGLHAAYANVGSYDRNYRIVGGLGLLCDRLAMDRTVITGAKVRGIRWSRHRASVQLHDGSVICCRALVLAVPLEELAELDGQATPHFPTSVSEPTRVLKLGVAAKVVVHVRGGRWPNFSAYATDREIEVWWNQTYDGGRAIIGFTAGPGTAALAPLSDQSIVSHLCEDIAAIGGHLKPRDVVQVEKCLWNRAGRRAYSYIPVGAMGQRENLMQSVERTIWIAGEAAERPGLAGTIVGAVSSARRVASDVIEEMRRAGAI